MFLLPRKRRALSFSTSSPQRAQSSSTELPSPATRRIEGLTTPYSSSNIAIFRTSPPSTAQVNTATASVAPFQSLQLPATPIHLNHTASATTPGPAANTSSTPRCKKTFPCRVCGFILATSYNRLRHERSKHAGALIEATTEPSLQQQLQLNVGGKRSAAHAFDENEPTPGGPAAASSRVADAVRSSFSYAHSQAATELHFEGFDNMEAAATTASDQDTGEELSPAAADHDQLDELEPADMELDMDAAAAAPSQVELGLNGAEGVLSGELAVNFPGAVIDHGVNESTNGAAAILNGVYEPAPLLQDTQLQAACLPFLQWMCQPPITQVEALIKARRVKVITQLQPIKLNLRFIFGLLLDVKAITELELQALTRLTVCQALGAALEKREVGSGRIHAIFLLVKKVLVYLSSCESTRKSQFISPATQESYMYVESICSDSSHRRKQEARNRAMLGVQTSKLLHQSQPTRGLPALPANAFIMPSLQGNIEIVASKPVASPPLSSIAPPAQAIPSIAAADMEPSSNELTGEELKSVAFGSLEYLKLRDSAYYMHHLVTATLCLGLAPRSQVLKQLRIGSSFVKEADGRYWVKMLAELNKNGKPTVFALPLQLTEPFDYYLESVRPALLQQSGQEHDYVFFKKNGTAPRTDFSELTALATQQLIQRPVNAHAFRSAVITAFYETGATQGDMDVLANIMAHDSATARTYYFKPQMAKAAVNTNDRMLQVLNLDNALSTNKAVNIDSSSSNEAINAN